VLAISSSFFFTSSILANILDTTFAEEGVVTTSIDHYGDAAKAVIIDKNNKILVAGTSDNGSNLDFSLARYNEDGTLDTSFNFDGVVTTQIGSEDDHAQAIALQANGKIIVGGYTDSGQDTDFALVRYNSDGGLDQEFGLGGIVVLPIGKGDDTAHTVAVQTDGSILIAGAAGGTSGRVAAIARVDTYGSPDQSFGHAGVVFSGGGKDTVINDLLLQEDGTILVSGQYKDRDGTTLLLMRYLANGQPDLTFGLAGAADTEPIYSTETTGTSIYLQENGAILIAGSTGSDNNQDIALFRFLQHGQYDPSFGTRGMVSRDIDGEADGAYDIVSIPDGIVVGGYSTTNGLRDFVLLKYSFTGIPVKPNSDTGAKQNNSLNIGKPIVEESYVDSPLLRKIEAVNNPEVTVTTTSISSFDDTGYGMAVQDDNKIILVGSSGDDVLKSYAIARYKSDGSAVTATKSTGATSTFIRTTAVTEITRNSAITGGTIYPDSGLTFSSKGVVFSIAPYPTVSGAVESTVFPVDFAEPTPKTPNVSVETKESQSKTIVAPTTLTTKKVSIPGDTDEPVENGKTEDGAGVGPYSSILKDLSIGTRYYVRAYAVTSSGTVYYGDQLTFETKDACFIATAAYGSFANPHVTTLRSFRDMYLKPFALGRIFIDTYYHYSPLFSQSIDQYPALRPVVRVLLIPFIGVSYILVNIGELWRVLLACGTGFLLLFGVWQLRVQRKVL
ncbi:hypothetical protein JYU00_01790, partial [bacterium AH-315-N22]|nr:hypothetical protein [bacterium AH-315-N22]